MYSEKPETLEKYEFRSMEDVSLDVQFSWALKALAEKLKTTKKVLRKAWKIIGRVEFEDEIMVKGKSVQETFSHGFRGFTLRKGKKPRKILAPHPIVQKALRAIGKTLVELRPAHQNAYGFVKKRNTLKATQTLLGNVHYFSFDIADAFPSITKEMVKQSLEKLGINKALIDPLSWLVTYHYNEQRRLPQGASCSPALLNLVYEPMCCEMDRICQTHNIKWFVYADDFNFASKEIISPEIKEELLAIPTKSGFSVKPEKTKDNLGKTTPHMLGLTIVGKKHQKIHINHRKKNAYRRIFFMAWKYDDAYPKKYVIGIAMYIRQIYGQEQHWPGWVREYWILYREKIKEAENERKSER